MFIFTFSLVSFFEAFYGFAREVFGSLSTNLNSSLVGIVAKGWSDWLIALFFITLTSTWIWILDKKWERVLRRLYPSLTFIDGVTSLLYAIDILLLSCVTFHQCCVNVPLSPVSLVLSTTLLRASLCWIHRFWPVSRAYTGGSTNGKWNLHSLHRVGFVSILDWSAFPALPSGNIRSVLLMPLHQEVNLR